MFEWIMLVLGISLFLYALLAGADYGAGIWWFLRGERLREEQSELIDRAMGPVWEANHIWLILALVILFNGFPGLFGIFCDYYHYHLTLLCLGIIGRGTAFTFKHYDPTPTPFTQHWYGRIFAFSSVWTAFWIGVVVGSLMLGAHQKLATEFTERFIWFWFNPFCLLMGVFVCSVFAFNAALFLMGEAEKDDLRKLWRNRAVGSLISTVLIGGLALGVLYFTHLERWKLFFGHAAGIVPVIVATIVLPFTFRDLRLGYKNRARILTGIQLAAILLAGFLPQYPVFMDFTDAPSLTFIAAAAPAATLTALGWSLLAGVILIFPAYIWLMRVFKAESFEK